jgi:hypothetical protein
MVGIGVHGTIRKFVEMFVDEVVRALEAERNKWSSHAFGIGGL